MPALSRADDKRDPTQRVKALVGKEGWLFLYNDSNHSLDQYIGRVKPSPKLLASYAETYRQRQACYRQRGIRYLVAVVPSKEHLYPEFLPDGFVQGAGPSMAEQFIAAINPGLDLPVIDLKQVLSANKWRGPLCHKTDSHWNYLGAMVATQAVVDKIKEGFPAMPAFNEADFKLSAVRETLCDMTSKPRVDFVNGRYLPSTAAAHEDPPRQAYAVEHVKHAVELHDHAYQQVPGIRPTRLFRNGRDAHLPRAIILRDSYAEWMIPFLVEYFSECLLVWSRKLDEAVVDAFKPDVIVEQVVDRFLWANHSRWERRVRRWFKSVSSLALELVPTQGRP